ncbi:MAG TPA: PAS domain-containing protein, partial [Thermodesulfobacteriota bacterium]|nr:PAS domain-containing protein [Thermodesulfobacteriota bacterium]
MQQLSQPGEDLFPEISQLQDRLDEAEARLKLTGMIPPRIEQLYRAVMDNLLEGALIILANGTVLYSNNNFAEMVGLRASQMIGSQIFDFVSESDLENFRGALWKAQSGRTKCEVQLR